MKENTKMKSEKPKKQFKGGKGIASNFAQGFEQPTKWYNELPEEPKEFPKVTDTVLIELKEEAKKCNDAEVATYTIKNQKTNSDYQWMKTVMSKGTISDKIAAYTVIIQDDPVCNLSTVQNLVNMVKVGKKKECLVVIDTLSELFISDLLIPDRKLRAFHERPLSKLDEFSSGNAATRKKYLSIWYFEDQLKECYTQLVLALNKAAHDSVDANKEKAISAMYRLLAGNPEQEKNLLCNIVNKLGDPSQKVASKSIYCLGQLLKTHPVMKQVVLNEIEKLLFRQNVSQKAQYYGVCFLAQFYLCHEDYELAKNLITVYFSFFKMCVKKGDVDSRMMSALLMGVNRAYPFAKTEFSKISEHIDTLYKVVHVANFSVALHTLNLLFQVSDVNNVSNDRFYTALYKKLLDPNMATTTHQALLLNLIFRALKNDKNVGRTRAFIKRLLQLALYMQPQMACGILYLVFHIMHKRAVLLAKRMKSEPIEDEEEHYEDVETDGGAEGAANAGVKAEVEEVKEVKGSSWLHTDIAIKSEYNHAPITSYNPLHRNPLYAGGEFCVYTELLNLQKHFHPTVALFATNILNEQNISYSGDPLQDFTLIRFLERFSFKNPKKIEDVQKPGVNPVFGKRKLYVPTGAKAHSVLSANYLQIQEKNIPVEEMYLYKYVQKRNEHRPVKEDKDDDDFSDDGSVGDEEFEAMLDEMARKKGAGVTDDDDDFGDVDFMREIGDSLKNTQDDEGSGSDQSDDDEMAGAGDAGGFEEAGEGLSSDDTLEDDGSDIEFNDSEQEEGPPVKKGKNAGDVDSLFASADEFASILDEEPDFMAGTSHQLSNKDKAHRKQLAWEQTRNAWVKGARPPKSHKKHFAGKKLNRTTSIAKNKKQKR